MKWAIKLELYRAFHNKGYWAALSIPLMISLYQFIFWVLPASKSIAPMDNLDYPCSVFNHALMLELTGPSSTIYYYVVILVAAIPMGSSYYTDLREGYIKNLYVRMERKHYLSAKYLAVFISAGSIFVIPLLLNLLLTSMVMPAIIPQYGGSFAIIGNTMLKELFYTHPWGYVIVYLIIDFVMAGLLACMALSVTKFIYNKYIVMFSPFLFCLILQIVAQLSYYNAAAPLAIIDAQQSVWMNMPTVIIEISLLFLVSFSSYMIGGGKNRDTL